MITSNFILDFKLIQIFHDDIQSLAIDVIRGINSYNKKVTD